MNKTLAIELEDFKARLISALYDEELALWHGSSMADGGWNNAIFRAVEVVGEVK